MTRTRTDLFVKTLVACAVAGAVAAAVVTGLWLLATGALPPMLMILITVDAAVVICGWWCVERPLRKWRAVVDAYYRPAFGEGVDTPHRPPLDGKDGEL